MPVAVNMMRPTLNYRRDAFNEGLQAAGFTLKNELHQPREDDLLLTWNRYGHSHEIAKRYEFAKAKIIVAENGYLGKNWLDGEWFALARDHHNGAGRWPLPPEESIGARWASLGQSIEPWREGGREIILLPQRGIGEPGVRMPGHWVHDMMQIYPTARIRVHPGDAHEKQITLLEDIKDAKFVVTWGSGAALKALLFGIPVLYSFNKWIGASAATWVGNEPVKGDRLKMFQRLAWAQWTLDDVRSGKAIKKLCDL